MNCPLIRELSEGDTINQVFRLANRQLLQTRAGKPYLNLVLGDSSGEIEAKVWDSADVIHQQLEGYSYLRVIGRIDSYRDKLQVKTDQLKPISDDDVDPAMFLPVSSQDPDQMLEELKTACLEVLENPYIIELLQQFFDDEEMMLKFKQTPAAKGLHHTYVGGLLEHTLSVTKICLFLSEHYTGVNRDLLVAGAVFHDIGKVRELTTLPNFEYTTEGRLIGHVVIGLNIMEAYVENIENFPKELKLLLSHMLLSHMGEHEFKSPVVPMFTEAMLLHSADNLDAKVEVARYSIDNDQNEKSEFTGYHRLLERFFYKGVTGV